MSCSHYRKDPNDYCFSFVRRVEGDGHLVAFRKCNRCGENWDGRFVSKDKVNFDSLPWSEPMPVIKCERCGKEYAQLHHYLPRALARKHGENAETWPKQNLCGDCHGTWHTVVTPGLVKKDW